jgi:hypothetical protein
MNGAGTTSHKLTPHMVSIGMTTKMRQCVACRIRRSISQFSGACDKCIRCVRRGL